jgi:uncharacterized circularly permuted ATP-grasp superfamily protein
MGVRAYDELLEQGGDPREHARRLIDSLNRLGYDRLRSSAERRDAIFLQQGITFDTYGPDGETRDRPFPLDLIPRLIPDGEWQQLERGIRQRVLALNRFVADVYGAGEIVRDGIVPWELVMTRAGFLREAHGIEPPGGVWCHVSGCDLVRDADGTWRALEDNVRVPSGISYVLENRAAMSRLVPELFDEYAVRPVGDYPERLLGALRSIAPGGAGTPTVVVWTPGPANSAYFEHAFLARRMGVELVQAGDLVVRDATCYLRTTTGLARVDAIYRRVDDAFIDPLELRPDSLLGVPGLTRAFREGNVAIANAPGTGVADDKAIYHYVPEMIRYYLGEEPLIANVPTYLLSDPEQREYVLDNLGELVVKPTGESGGAGVFVGPTAGPQDVAEQRALVERDPSRWIAQDTIWLSTVPTMSEEGALAPRHVDLRPFAVFGESVWVAPGGLTRVAMREGSMIVNSSRGGGSKDTWVLAPEGAREPAESDAFNPPTMPGMRQIGWTEQERQQQQHGDRGS